MNITNMEALLRDTQKQNLLKELYGESHTKEAMERFFHIGRSYHKNFGDSEFEFFSAPGRTEICGNHTDHNNGKVLAASIQMDCIAAAAKNNMPKICLISETYDQKIEIHLGSLEPEEGSTGTDALLKGLLSGFLEKGYSIGGFNAYITSNVISAAGLSSSASFEMLVCTILNHLFNDGKADTITYAQIGQYSENLYWNKQSGLLDQIACAAGGLISIDFAATPPKIIPLDFSFEDMGYDLIIVNTGKGHGNLSEEYSSIPAEMKAVASYFNKATLRDVTMDEVLQSIAPLRNKLGDRAVLRALHYFCENTRVEEMVKALELKNYPAFLELICASGKSSYEYLQNCYCEGQPKEEPIPVALFLTQLFLEKIKCGACRVHGGGFAGVIMVLLPARYTKDYTAFIEDKIGDGSVYPLFIRKHGAILI